MQGAQEKEAQFSVFQASHTYSSRGGGVGYLEERLTEFSEVYFPFITFPSNGQPD